MQPWYSDMLTICLTGKPAKLSKSKLAKLENNVTFQNYFRKFCHDALYRYKIEGLPDTVDERVVMQSLLWYGSVVFFEKNGGLIALPGAGAGKGWNIYGDPGEAWVYSFNGRLNERVSLFIPHSDKADFLRELISGYSDGKPRGVMVWENSLRTPFIDYVMWYATRVSDVMRTIDVCMEHLKMPYIIVAQQEVVNTVKEFFNRVNNNEDFILTTGVFPIDKVNVLPFENSPDAIKAAAEMADWYENKWRETCGRENNSQIDKKGENLNSTEITVNDEYTELGVDSTIENLNIYLGFCNEFFGTNMRAVPNRKEVDDNDDLLGNDEDGKSSVSDDRK